MQLEQEYRRGCWFQMNHSINKCSTKKDIQRTNMWLFLFKTLLMVQLWCQVHLGMYVRCSDLETVWYKIKKKRKKERKQHSEKCCTSMNTQIFKTGLSHTGLETVWQPPVARKKCAFPHGWWVVAEGYWQLLWSQLPPLKPPAARRKCVTDLYKPKSLCHSGYIYARCHSKHGRNHGANFKVKTSLIAKSEA